MEQIISYIQIFEVLVQMVQSYKTWGWLDFASVFLMSTPFLIRMSCSLISAPADLWFPTTIKTKATYREVQTGCIHSGIFSFSLPALQLHLYATWFLLLLPLHTCSSRQIEGVFLERHQVRMEVEFAEGLETGRKQYCGHYLKTAVDKIVLKGEETRLLVRQRNI